MIETIGLSILFLKKEAYTGSHHGIRYRLSKDEDTLKACVYPEPYCFEATKDEQKLPQLGNCCLYFFNLIIF